MGWANLYSTIILRQPREPAGRAHRSTGLPARTDQTQTEHQRQRRRARLEARMRRPDDITGLFGPLLILVALATFAAMVIRTRQPGAELVPVIVGLALVLAAAVALILRHNARQRQKRAELRQQEVDAARVEWDEEFPSNADIEIVIDEPSDASPV